MGLLMKYFNKLSHQLLILIIVVFLAFFLTLGIILPQVIVPSAESNIYSYLREPLEFVQSADSSGPNAPKFPVA